MEILTVNTSQDQEQEIINMVKNVLDMTKSISQTVDGLKSLNWLDRSQQLSLGLGQRLDKVRKS